MKNIALFTLLVICGSVLADDCVTLNTQATCTGNSNCNYTATGGKCDNKCTILAKADCENPTNSPNCDSNAAKCDIPLNCQLKADTKTNCLGSKACNWIDPIPATCDFKNKSTTSNTCNNKTADKTTCESNGMCAFSPPAFKSCDYNQGQCSSKKTAATCDSSFCTKTDTVCTQKAPGYCSSKNQSDCQASLACSYTGGVCVEVCDTLKEDDACNSNAYCYVNSNFACADKQDAGQTQCQTTNTNDGCTSPFCKKTLGSATCLVVDTYCSDKTEINCGNDTVNCILNSASPSKCLNKAPSTQCMVLSTKTDCEGNDGCSWTAYSCSNKTTKSCLATDKEVDCTANAKFCTFTPTGTCEAKSNSFILSAVGSLLTTLLLF